jgi:hypothetical protein
MKKKDWLMFPSAERQQQFMFHGLTRESYCKPLLTRNKELNFVVFHNFGSSESKVLGIIYLYVYGMFYYFKMGSSVKSNSQL